MDKSGSMKKGIVEKPKEKMEVLPKIKKVVHPQIETLSTMFENLMKNSEATYRNIGKADFYESRVVPNIDRLNAASQKPLSSRFYHLIRSLKS